MTTAVVVLVLVAVVVLVIARAVVIVQRHLAEWRRTLLVAGALAPVAATGVVGTVGVAAVPGPFLAVVAAAAVGAGLLWWHRRAQSGEIVRRWRRRALRTSGVATWLELLRVGSAWAMRRQARIVRPSLARLSRRELRRLAPAQYATHLMRVGRQRVYASHEDAVAVAGGPRTGKTGMTAAAIVDAPGATVVTSTRLDLWRMTRAMRAQRGPVLVFNPGGLGGVDDDGRPRIPSTIGFDPLHGCRDGVVALQRALDMIPTPKGDADREHWVEQAQRVLAIHLHAAALGQRDMHAVQRWIANPDEAEREVRALLRKSSNPAFVADLEQFTTTNTRTRSSITTGITKALHWLMSPAAVAATVLPEGGEPFDVRRFIAERGTVYLLGRDEAHTSSLMAALVGYIMREARQLASEMPNERLDPALFMALDEAGRAAPVPLDDWTGDAGGSGVTLYLAVQSFADLRDRWGASGASKILSNCLALVHFGGVRDHDDLKLLSELAGDRDETVVTRDRDGVVSSRTTRPTPVLPVSRLSNLPKWHAVLFRRGMAPAIGRPEMVWNRADVRAARAAARFESALDGAWAATADRTAVVRAAELAVREAEQLLDREDAAVSDVAE